MSYTIQTDFIAARMRDLFQSHAYRELVIHECRHPGAGQSFIAVRGDDVLTFGQRWETTIKAVDLVLYRERVGGEG